MNQEPYQAASDEMIRQSNIPKNALKTAGKFGAALATGSAVLPFLSSYIPENLMIKGLSKINPQIGKFVSSALASGESIDTIKDFIKDKIEPKEEENAQESGNVIEQYSPELNQFIMSEIDNGREPLEAGALASLNPKFKKIIDKLTKDHKSPFSTLIQTVYGQNRQANQQLPQMQNQAQQTEPYQQASQQNNQIGPGQQQLLSVLQEVKQVFGNK